MNTKIGTITAQGVSNHFASAPIAYFCAEFALDDNLPIYAGGLGVLAGDVLMQAEAEKLPMIGVGLLYHNGYLHQEISKDANIMEQEVVDFQKSGLLQIVKDGTPITITLPMPNQDVIVTGFIKKIGQNLLLLLNTNLEENEVHAREITDRLYYGDREHRFEQEMVLGIGGFRMLKALGIEPDFYHINEGHSALIFYEISHDRIQKNPDLKFSDAIKDIRNVVFTNHTLVPAGNDVFSRDLVSTYLSRYAQEFPIDTNDLIKPGLIEDTSLFAPTMLALRLATISQAVSKLHAKKALEVWSHHPMIPVTNGVRLEFWQSKPIALAKSQGDAVLWEAHLEKKRRLCAYIAQTTGTQWDEGDFILGWSRRIARYKRPMTIFEDMDKLKTFFAKKDVKVRIVISGKPHAGDQIGVENLREILHIVGESDGHVVYLQNYSLSLAQLMLSGVDVLVNTPVRGFEACGTSGMKAGLNGVLACTTLDGWTDEVDFSGLGWVLSSDHVSTDFYEKMEHEILPMFLSRDKSGVPSLWITRMRKTIALIESRYTASRMLKELRELVYTHTKL